MAESKYTALYILNGEISGTLFLHRFVLAKNVFNSYIFIQKLYKKNKTNIFLSTNGMWILEAELWDKKLTELNV